MTTIVKKRLQAVVALLVCFMVLFAALPADVFDGIFNMTVHAVNTTIYFDTGNNFYGSSGQIFNYNDTTYQWGTSWAKNSQMYVYWWDSDVSAGTGMTTVTIGSGDESCILIQMEEVTEKASHWSNGKVYKAVFSGTPAGVIFTNQGTTWFENPSGSGWQNGNGNYSIDIAPVDNKVYNIVSSVSGYSASNAYVGQDGAQPQPDWGKRLVGTERSYDDLSSTTPPSTADKSILVGVKYYNYFYDEQIAYEMAGGTDDPTSLTVTNGQAKNPYTLFNRAIMASDYGGNNTIRNHGSDGSGGNKTSYPVMYLGEFWLGGGAENNGIGYTSSPNDVSAGKYPRSVNINDGGNTVTVSDLKGGTKIIDNDKLTNFTWGANLASRGPGAAQKYYHMLAQGLVDNTLSMDPTSPNYLVPTINGQRIPYFDENFLYASKNSDLDSITGNGTAGSGKDVGRVYTSIFPFYRKPVTLKATDDATYGINTNAWSDKWIRTPSSGANEWGTSLTTGNATYPSEYYTFNSLTNTVSINTAGGASSDTGSGVTGYGDTYKNMSLNQAVAYTPNTGNGEKPNVFTADVLANLKSKYTQANRTEAANQGLTNLPPVIDDTVATSTSDTYSVANIARAINIYKNGAVDSDDVALLTIAGQYDNTATDGVGHVKDVDAQNGYFPFNKSSDNLNQLQYGFGTRLDIRFNISKDGQVLSTDGTHKVDEIFRFTGDDDVWVFIDGQLVLDMGGGHKNGIGEINFHTCEAAVLYAGDANSTSAWTSSVQGSGDSTTGIKTYGSSTKIGTLLTNIKNEAAGGISEDHTLTMFYMERGKLNSNMSVMFNFKAPDIIDLTDPTKDFPATPAEIPAPNPVTTSKLKIREISNFENVNPGLIGLTKKAAEDDVFKYSISSNIQRTVDMASSWVLSPSKDTYVRTAETDSTKTTTLSTGFAAPTDSGSLVYVKLQHGSTDYMEDFNNCKATALWVDLGGTSRRLVLGQKIDDYLFAYEIPNGLLGNQYSFRILYANDDAAAAKFVEGTTHPNTQGVNFTGNTAPNARQSLKSTYKLSSNGVYTVATWSGDEFQFISEGTLSDLTDAQKYAVNNFLGNGSQVGVANTNYVWKEAFTTKTGSSDSRLVNTTTAGGTFNLLYGTSDDANESSALFINQFYKASPYSNFTVAQSMAKRQPSVAVNSYADADRSMGKYYSTKASTVKRNAPIGTGTSNMTGTLVEDLLGGATVTGQSSVASGDISVNSPDMDIIISNYINVANVSVRKVVQYETVQGAYNRRQYGKPDSYDRRNRCQ